jgi:tRNA(fMet)-specific endonuclease VapC
MGLRYLLDANILSEPVKKQPNHYVIAALSKHVGQYCTCVTVWHELIYGIALLDPSKKKDSLNAYLDSLVRGGLAVLPYEEQAARWFAQERARLSRVGITVPMADGEIASISTINNLTLVTRNVGDFENYEGLALENWFAPTLS